MSKNYHATIGDLKRKTKKEIDNMVDDSDSILNELVKKIRVKKKVKQQRKIIKIKETKL